VKLLKGRQKEFLKNDLIEQQKLILYFNI